MGEALVLDIVFFNPDQEYYAGEAVSGVVSVQLQKPLPLTTIQIELKGKGSCQWTGFSSRNNKQTNYTSKIGYLHKTIIIDITSLTDNSVLFDIGTHEFPFSIIIPEDLPESFEGIYGYVRYNAIATVKSATFISFLRKSCSTKKTFGIRAIHPLPIQLNNPKCIYESQTMSSFWCSWIGDISVKMSTNKAGYLVGETIAFKAEIENSSSKDLSNVTLTLKQAVTYSCNSDHEVTSVTVGDTLKFARKLRSHESVTWSDLFTVPLNITPTYMNESDIIDIEYYLQLKVGENAGWFASNVLFKFPLIFGRV